MPGDAGGAGGAGNMEAARRESVMARKPVDFAAVIEPLYRQTNAHQIGIGVLLTSGDAQGRPNVMTIGWGLYGWFHHDRPVAVVAVRPACYTFGLLDQIGEFVRGVPTEELRTAVAFCGEQSGRDHDKFKACGLTAIPSALVRPPPIAECPLHVECRIYHKQTPPHLILTPEHREKPLAEQHTIYFAEVLGAFVMGR